MESTERGAVGANQELVPMQERLYAAIALETETWQLEAARSSPRQTWATEFHRDRHSEDP